ncbi:MAG: asparagine synthase (glutamine-hydrolyzing), partial [Candidatus Poribacteria bacterium]
CGIAGIFNLNKFSIDKSILKQMTDIIKHRGPDDEGFYLNENIGLGHRRLSIIDLSSAGHQPMSNDNETIWIVYNGEIYNYIELRDELIKYGYKFRTNTDTEVIIKAYEKWGESCLEKLNGMFAFALWDNLNKKLFCARDRFGIKPFYYYFDGKIFVFASEIKAILLHPDVPKRPNEPIIYDFLVLQILDHTDNTFFDGIKQLLPSQYLILYENGNTKIHNWFNIKSNDELGDFSDKKDKEYAEQFLHLFTNGIRRHLISDVPVGSCLSGGLDSSSVVCIANKLIFDNGVAEKKIIGERQKTFTAVYEDKSVDESHYAEEVIRLTSAEKNFIFPDGDMLWQELEKVTWHQEEPFLSTSIYAQWNVTREASNKGVKVLLDGQGGDELLGGYYSRFIPVWAKTLLKKGHPVRMMNEIKAFSDVIRVKPKNVIISTLADFLPKKAVKFIKSLSQKRSPLINGNLYDKYQNRFFFGPRYCNLNDYMDVIMGYGLLNLLRYEDRNSMAFSVEARVPFLDSEFVKFACQLPLTQKIRGGWSKVILRNAMKGILPESIRLRRPKLGFATPEHRWLTQNRDQIRNIFVSNNFRSDDFVSRNWILSNLDAILSEKQAMNLWSCISLGIWMRVWEL